MRVERGGVRGEEELERAAAALRDAAQQRVAALLGDAQRAQAVHEPAVRREQRVRERGRAERGALRGRARGAARRGGRRGGGAERERVRRVRRQERDAGPLHVEQDCHC